MRLLASLRLTLFLGCLLHGFLGICLRPGLSEPCLVDDGSEDCLVGTLHYIIAILIPESLKIFLHLTAVVLHLTESFIVLMPVFGLITLIIELAILTDFHLDFVFYVYS